MGKFAGMKQPSLAIQQLMLGSVIKNEADAVSALRTVKEAGFDAIELNGFMIQKTGLLVQLMTRAAGMPVGRGGTLDWKSLVAAANLSVSSLHSDLGTLKNKTASVVENARAFGTKYVVLTGMYRFDYTDFNGLNDLVKDLNACGKRLSDEGISLLYHNHNVEFLRLRNADGTMDDRCAYDFLLSETDPRYVNFELDTYWAAEAGVDVLSLMDRLGERMRLWHINDRGSKMKGQAMTPILTSDSMELGTGNLPLEKMLAKAIANDVDAIILESHRNFIDKDPMKSIAVSGRWLQENLKDE